MASRERLFWLVARRMFRQCSSFSEAKAQANSGIVHMPGDILYGVAKAGVVSLARSLGARVASEGITVNACKFPFKL
jgi:NAD(P)-dependent dehydrogenase (short-subunit alcohol dehydrogenase family)